MTAGDSRTRTIVAGGVQRRPGIQPGQPPGSRGPIARLADRLARLGPGSSRLRRSSGMTAGGDRTRTVIPGGAQRRPGIQPGQPPGSRGPIAPLADRLARLGPGSSRLRRSSGMTAGGDRTRTVLLGGAQRRPGTQPGQAAGSRGQIARLADRLARLGPGSSRLRRSSGMTAGGDRTRTVLPGGAQRRPGIQPGQAAGSSGPIARLSDWPTPLDPGSSRLRRSSGMTAGDSRTRTIVAGGAQRRPGIQPGQPPGSRGPIAPLADRLAPLDPGSSRLRRSSGTTAGGGRLPPLSSRAERSDDPGSSRGNRPGRADRSRPSPTGLRRWIPAHRACGARPG